MKYTRIVDGDVYETDLPDGAEPLGLITFDTNPPGVVVEYLLDGKKCHAAMYQEDK